MLSRDSHGGHVGGRIGEGWKSVRRVRAICYGGGSFEVDLFVGMRMRNFAGE